jgi:hypothetical protein
MRLLRNSLIADFPRTHHFRDADYMILMFSEGLCECHSRRRGFEPMPPQQSFGICLSETGEFVSIEHLNGDGFGTGLVDRNISQR